MDFWTSLKYVANIRAGTNAPRATWTFNIQVLDIFSTFDVSDRIISIILNFNKQIIWNSEIHTDDSVDVTSEPLEQDMLTGAASQHTTKKNHQLEVQLGGTVTLQCPQGSLGCWSHLDPVNSRLRGLGSGLSTPTGIFSLKDIVYQDAGTYKCVGQTPTNKKKLEVLHTMSLNVKGTENHFHKIQFKFSHTHISFIWINSQALPQCRCAITHRLHIPAHHFTYPWNFVPIRLPTQHAGYMAIESTRPATNMVSMCWPMELLYVYIVT